MKILFYINTLGGGGAERALSSLASSLAKTNQVVIVNSYPVINEYKINSKIKHLYLDNEQVFYKSRLFKNYIQIKKLRSIIKRENPKIVISFMAEPNFRAILACLFLKTKVIISVRNDPKMEYGGLIGKILGKVLLPLSDGCVFQTEEARQWFPKKLQKKSEIICNGVSSEFYNIVNKPIKGNIISVGRLTKQKNQKLLIMAFYELKKMVKGVSLTIYGEGKERKNLEALIKKMKLSDCVFLNGTVKNIPNELEKADIFVMSSNYEGMPNALLEAMAAGVACVSTDCPCGGPQMLIDSMKNGILVPTNNVKAMLQALLKLQNQKFREKIASCARNSVSNFNMIVIEKKWEYYINEVLNKNKEK